MKEFNMREKVSQVTAFVTFEMVVDIPEELQFDENAINELVDEAIASNEILNNCTDSGEMSRVSKMVFD